MQATISRPNHLQNLLSLAIFMLLICYYAFNGVPKSNSFLIENSPEQSNTVVLETSISQLRAAVLMDADIVQTNGLLYAVETSLENFIAEKKANTVIQNIHNQLLLGNKKNAVRLINELPTLILLQ
jgi:hypothetical protein